MWIFFGKIFHIKEYSKQNSHLREERLRHHTSLRRRYRRWKKDKRRKKLQRKNSDSTEDGNNSPNAPQPQTQKRTESDLNLPAYRFDGQILEQQLHAQQVELLRQQSVAPYGQNLNEQQNIARLPSLPLSPDPPSVFSPNQVSTLKLENPYEEPSYAKLKFKTKTQTVRFEKKIRTHLPLLLFLLFLQTTDQPITTLKQNPQPLMQITA